MTTQSTEVPHQFWVQKGWRGVNTLLPREAIEDGEHGWLENWMPMGTALLPVPGPETPSLTSITVAAGVARTVARFWHVNINGINYLLVWVSEGEMWQYNLDTMTGPTKISGAVTLGGPDVSQWKSERALIADQTAGYYSWNGTDNLGAGGSTQIDATKYTKVATYAGRVWLGNVFTTGPRTYVATAPNTYNDFTATNGAIAVVVTEAELRQQILQLVTNGDYLYVIGDNAAFYIANVQANGVHSRFPVNTTAGAWTYGSATRYEKQIFYLGQAQGNLVVGLESDSVTDKIAPSFTAFSANTFITASLAHINGILVPMFRVTYADPVLGNRILYIGFVGQEAFFLSQGNEKWTASVELLGKFYTYATDGTNIYRLFQNTSGLLQKTATSKRYDFTGNPAQHKVVVNAGVNVDLTAFTGTLTLTVRTEKGAATTIDLLASNQLPVLTWVDSFGRTITFTTSNGGAITWLLTGLETAKGASGTRGNFVDYTLAGTNPGVSVSSTIVEYVPGDFFV